MEKLFDCSFDTFSGEAGDFEGIIQINQSVCDSLLALNYPI